MNTSNPFGLTVTDIFGNLPTPDEGDIAESFGQRLAGVSPTVKVKGAIGLPTTRAVAGAYFLHNAGIPFTRSIDSEGRTSLVVWAVDIEKIKD